MSVQAEIEVLLATHNGARFLKGQVDSILAQGYPNLRLLARDDGSNDGTVEILNEYVARFPDRFRVLPSGVATGDAKRNFLMLITASTADYVCFADQDDVWLADKVSTSKQAMDELESRLGRDIPLLVFTDLRVVDEQLRTLQESFWRHNQLDPKRVDRLAALLAQNVVTGCTAMLNRRLVALALRMPEAAVMHDQWIALAACAMGKGIGIESQTVLYRQHGGNLVGAEQRTGSFTEFAARVRKTDKRVANWERSREQAKAFLSVYRVELSTQGRKTLQAYIRCLGSPNRLVRIYTLIRYGFFRSGLLRKLSMLRDFWRLKPDDPEVGKTARS